MSICLIPQSCGDDIQKNAKFTLVGSTWRDSKGIKWMPRNKLCVAKENGGMGFRNLITFNLA